ncbi:2-hydroxyacid dehydrogenase [Mycolicibacterium cosmeticum]|uniref:D-isomer specific 2-hydroxyacid dehydrogenase n=1 Tax=Mycolicibacterium cosmeticum TaxID=258533 RepID=W9ATM3_MYCCO|nr:2-hydroxyacid dehydrogenase [Mycolicibacterium cosmeticum]CDO09114.1 D-isomer specific 2-hydroxyacid dehydrogenase [Mycolicibacterium cosmeticum]
MSPVKVLVPDDLGVKVLGESPALAAIRYEPGAVWPADGHDAEVVVVGFDNAAAVGAHLAELPRLRLVQTLNAGYEQWLPWIPPGVALSNGRGAHGGSSAEWVVAALLNIFRDLRSFGDQQAAGVWEHRSTETLIGKRVVILGAGDLAVNLAARLAPFETEVTLVGRRPRAGVRALDDLADLLPRADVLVAMLPADASTYRLVDGAVLAQLPDGAVVVNAGRGGAIHTDALLAELTSGRLRAALDVTDPEPLPPGHPLWSAPGLLITPHVAGSTEGAEERAWLVARTQIERHAAGGIPSNVVAGPGAAPE